MSKIIALQGKGDTGKTTAITLLSSILLANGYSRVPGAYEPHGKDFLDVFINGTKKVGITSAGDTYKLVFKRLNHLVANLNCDVCVCACRTRGGSVDAVKRFPRPKPLFIKKRIASTENQRSAANSKDAGDLFLMI